MRSRPWSTALVLALLSVAGGACRSSGDDDGVNPIDASDGDGSTPDDTKIQDIQSEEMDIGTAVTVRRVVVVAKDTYGSRKGNFYVMEPEGGEYSGVLVFGAPLDQVDAISVGDLVDIENAEKDEFSLDTDTATITELVGAAGGQMSVTRVGTGTVPAPHVVDALANGRLPEAMRKVEQEKWEHVLIKIENVTVTREVRNINGNPPDPTFKDFLVTGYYNVDSSLSEINLTPPTVAVGDCLASVTGMGDYFFNYKILPRAIGDIVPGGTGCPVPPGTTVEMIQNGTVADGAQVQLNNVIVTAIAFNHKNLWVADAAMGAPNHGIYVFRGSAAAELPASIVVGSRVNVSGTVDEFSGTDGGSSVTELTSAAVTEVAGAPVATVPVTGVTPASLIVDVTAEPYEGVLVKLDNVKVSGTESNVTAHQRMLTSGGTTFIADDDIYRFTITADTCYASIVGIWHYNAFPDTNNWVFLPRAGTFGAPASDLTTGGNCP